jgi:peptidyl-dipeptidase Dcp
MQNHRPAVFAVALVCLAAIPLSSQAAPSAGAKPSSMPAHSGEARSNPFLEPSRLPFHLPPFDRIKDSDYTPAFTQGMAEQRNEIDAIVHNPAAPTFENTIVALERSGLLLNRVGKTFFNLSANNSNPEMDKIEAEQSPKLSAHHDAIYLDAGLFARIDAVYAQRAHLGLDPESSQLLDRYEKEFIRAGAKLSDADKATLKKINEELSSVSTKFRQNTVASTKDNALAVDDQALLAGLPPQQINAAAAAAKARGLNGKWLITLQNTTTQASLAQLTNRATRERLFKASTSRGLGGPTDNRGVALRLLTLRAKKAALFGYPDFASYALAEETAETPAAVDRILGQLAPAALAKSKDFAGRLQQRIDAEARANHTEPFSLAAWDWEFYAQKERAATFGFDDSQIKPYFELDKVLQGGVFYAANQLYGITFTERKDLPVYHPDVRVFEVRDANGKTMGLILLDYYKRDNKQGGAWMDTFVDQSTLFGDMPVIINNLNVPKPAPGEPALLTFDDVRGMFHEFGHLLHGLFSNVKYPHLSGTSVPPDFGEFPSQFNEMWARDPKVLANFAKHYKTGEPMPKELLDKVLSASTFGDGPGMLSALESAMLDMSWHQTPVSKLPSPEGLPAFEEATLQQDGVLYPPVAPRYHTTYFLHIFTTGYEAGYYAYTWSEVLARDAGAWFNAHGGLTRANGDLFRAKILSRGRTKEPSDLFKDFYGKGPEIGPLLDYHGLPRTQESDQHH